MHKHRENGRVVRVSTRMVLGDALGGGPGVGRLGGQSGREHVIRGASQRDGSEPVQPEGPQELHLLEGLGRAPGGDDVQLQLLLAGPHPPGKGGEGRWGERTPAMAAGLTDHVWSLSEWLTYPTVQRK